VPASFHRCAGIPDARGADPFLILSLALGLNILVGYCGDLARHRRLHGGRRVCGLQLQVHRRHAAGFFAVLGGLRDGVGAVRHRRCGSKDSTSQLRWRRSFSCSGVPPIKWFANIVVSVGVGGRRRRLPVDRSKYLFCCLRGVFRSREEPRARPSGGVDGHQAWTSPPP
jgi:hypothetical protein